MKHSAKTLREYIKSNDFQEFHKKNSFVLELWKKIFSRRKELWLTQSELWKLSWISQNHISMYETWMKWEPSRDTIEKLALNLNVNCEYFSKKIDRKTIEIYAYILDKIKKPIDRLQYMKIPFFIDLDFYYENKKTLTSLTFKRYIHWPFDEDVYIYESIFYKIVSWQAPKFKYKWLKEEEINSINKTLSHIPYTNWNKLKKLSYNTAPLLHLWATIGWNEWMNKILNFDTVFKYPKYWKNT